MVVGHVFPDFGTRVVRSACLSAQHSPFGYFRHVEVSEFDDATLGQEHVSALDVSVANLKIVQRLETPNYLNKVVPDLFLAEPIVVFLFVSNQLQDVSTVGVFHHDAKTVC